MSTRRLLHQNNGRGPVVPYQLATPGNSAPLGATTFTRADATTCATQHSAAGVVSLAAAGVLRDQHWLGGVRTILLESSRKNVCKAPTNLGDTATWALNGTCTRTGGQADPAGGTNGWLIADTSNGDSIFNGPLLYTGDGVKSAALYLAPIATAVQEAVLYDITAGTDRCRIRVTWSSGVPTLAIIGGAGTLFRTSLMSNGYYRCPFAANGVVAANVNRFYVLPGGSAGQGSINGYGVSTEDAAFPTSFIAGGPNAQTTRAVDALSLAGSPLVGTLFYHYYDLATDAWADAVAAYAGNVAIVPPVDRAYSHIAVVQGTQSAAQCKAILGGYYP